MDLVDSVVARLNIEHYRKLLATETDDARRKVTLHLIAEEEEKLKILIGLPKQG